MAGGWAKEGAVQQQIDDTVEDAVAQARSRLPAGGEGAEHCEECGDPIPEARRQAIPGVRHCVACQEAHDADGQASAPFNRRASKDSQLR